VVSGDHFAGGDGGGVEVGDVDPLAAACPFDAGGPHQPGDLTAAHVVTGPVCRFPQLARPENAVVVLPQPDQGRTQNGVPAFPL